MQLQSYQALGSYRGFVVAPFAISQSTPVMLIRPDLLREVCIDDVMQLASELDGSITFSYHDDSTVPPSRDTYRSDFDAFHSQLLTGHFQKIVLSRCCLRERTTDIHPLQLFSRACHSYPRLFIALSYTRQSGLWLTASPELLLEGEEHSEQTHSKWRTIALAGTMKLEGSDLLGEGGNTSWSTKNIQEQRYVATYLRDCLEQYKASCGTPSLPHDICEEGPRTVRAANLVHLRSDITFSLDKHADIGKLLSALHPTPAVCGLPKADTYGFITSYEHTPRLYYSGFTGMLHMPSTRLYVSLRCMQITASHYRMYAGGGLLADSDEEQEWQETEAKLETMSRLLQCT